MARADLEVSLRARDGLTPTLRNVESGIIRFVGAVSAALAGLAVVSFPITAATEFDRALRDVQKTTAATDQEIAALGASLTDLSGDLSNSAVDLAGIAAAAGQLGIRGQANILAFTESIARAATTLDLVEESAARSIAKILNVFDIEASQTERITATINELTNTTAAQADQLINVIQRVGSIADLTFQQVAALGSTLIEQGLSPEVAGTSLVKFFSRLQQDGAKFAQVLGRDIGEFTSQGAFEQAQDFFKFVSEQEQQTQAQLISTLAGGGRVFAVFNKLVGDARRQLSDEALIDLTDQQSDLEEQLADIASQIENFDPDFVPVDARELVNLSGLQAQQNRIRAALSEVNEAIDEGQSRLTRNLETSNEAFIEGTSAIDEYERLSRALSVRIDVLGNNFTALAINAGNRLLPTLVALTNQVSEFLQGERASLFADRFGQALVSITEGALSAAEAVANLGIPLTQVLQILRALVAVAAANLFVGVTRSAVGFAASLGGLLPLLRNLAGAFLTLFAPVGRFVASFGGLSRVIGVVSTALRANPIGIAITVIGTAIAAAIPLIDRFGISLDSLKALAVEGLNAIGIQTQAQIEAAEAQALAARRATEEAVKAATAFNAGVDAAIRDQAGANPFEIDVAANIDVVGAVEQVENLTSNFQTVQEAIEGSAATLNAVVSRLERSREEANGFREAIAGANFQLTRQQEELSRLIREQSQSESGVTNQDEIEALEQEIQKTKELVAEKQRNLEQNQQNTTALEGQTRRVQEQTEVLRRNFENLRQGIVDSFSDEGVELLNLESERLRVQAELSEIRKSVESFDKDLADREGGAGAAVVDLEKLRQNRAETERELQELSRRIEEFRGQVSSADQALIGKVIENKDAEQVKELAIDINNAREAGEDFGGGLTKAFSDSAAEIVTQKFVLEDLIKIAKQGVDSLDDLRKAAKAVNDNTFTELRALQSSFQTFSNSIDGLLGNREISIRFDRRTQNLDNELADVLSRQEALEEQFSRDINEARNESERSYFRNRRVEALAALRIEEASLRDARAGLEERALRERLEFAQQRAVDLTTLARQAAERGNLDEALGLKDAGKASLEEAQQLVSDLANLTTDAGGTIKAALTDSEIGNLVTNLARVSQSVQSGIPGINETLQNTTQKAFEDADAKVQTLAKELEGVNTQFRTLFTGVSDLEGATKRLREAFERTTAGANLARNARNAGQGTQGVDDFQGRQTAQQLDALRNSVVAELRTARGVQEQVREGLRAADDPQAAAPDTRGFDQAALDLRASAEAITAQGNAQAQTGQAEGLAQEIKLLRQEQAQAIQNANNKDELIAIRQAIENQQAADTDDGRVALLQEELAVAEQQSSSATQLAEAATALKAAGEVLSQIQATQSATPTATPAPVAPAPTLPAPTVSPEIQQQAAAQAAQAAQEIARQAQEAAPAVELKAELTPEAPQALAAETNQAVDQVQQTDPKVEVGVGFVEGAIDSLVGALQSAVGIASARAATGGTGNARILPPAATIGVRGATGGLVMGPGSGTSDDIDAKLSNGEYIMDAQTRGFFGTNFFRTLQKLAASGRKLRTPAFATGGPVGRIPGDLSSPIISASGPGGAPVHIHLPGGDTVKLREGDTGINDVTKMFRRESSKRGRRV